ncbi:hypothetical protein [Helicobacter cinaedi]|uniref:hypothetical protein n=1 Tax=Helicobacter cinaedi TaxID=213 RepID=UPI001FB4002D|nr:hypothetical protein [Helicobacter cinaedi]
MSMLDFRRVIGSIVSFGFAPLLLCAKPVSVDEIFTKTSQFKILGNLSYINIHHSQLDVVQIPQQIAVSLVCLFIANYIKII